MNLQTIAIILAAALTVMVFSYLLGDNILYRLAIHLFVGVAAGYILIVSIELILVPWIQLTLIGGFGNANFVIGMIPILVGTLLLLKTSPRLARYGNLGLAFVLGIGGAVALWGAVAGTLIPLAGGVAQSLTPGNVVDGLIILIGTISTLVYFTYLGVRRPGGDVEQSVPVRAVGFIGRGFLVVTLGATFALVIISALTIFTGVIVNRLLPLRGG